jgi:hypothetical protein
MDQSYLLGTLAIAFYLLAIALLAQGQSVRLSHFPDLSALVTAHSTPHHIRHATHIGCIERPTGCTGG